MLKKLNRLFATLSRAGRKPKLVRSAKVVIVDKNNHGLVLRRSETHPWAAFAPDLPGGEINPDESHEQGLVREILEETALIVSPDSLVQADVFVGGIPRVKKLRIERTLYLVKIDETRPTVTVSWEHDQFDWIPVHDIQGLEDPVQGQLLRAIEKGLFSQS